MTLSNWFCFQNLVRNSKKQNQSPLDLAAADVQGAVLFAWPPLHHCKNCSGAKLAQLYSVTFSAFSFNALHLSPWRRNYFQFLPALKTFILNIFILAVFSKSVKCLLKGWVLRSLVFAQETKVLRCLAPTTVLSSLRKWTQSVEIPGN